MNGAIWTVPKSATWSGLDWLGAAAGSARGAAEGTDASSAGLTRSDAHARVAASLELLLPGGPGSRLPARPRPSGPTCVGWELGPICGLGGHFRVPSIAFRSTR